MDDEALQHRERKNIETMRNHGYLSLGASLTHALPDVHIRVKFGEKAKREGTLECNTGGKILGSLGFQFREFILHNWNEFSPEGRLFYVKEALDAVVDAAILVELHSPSVRKT